MKSSQMLIVTPETKLAALLASYPHVEDCLLQLSPAFSKLKNPVLRKTIGKVATMKQIAEIGKIPIAELINKIRSLVGQDNIEPVLENESTGKNTFEINEQNIKITLDARPMLEQGIHPLGQVLEEIQKLKPGELYELITPFKPIPLIEKVEAKGFLSKSVEKSSSEIRNYFLKN